MIQLHNINTKKLRKSKLFEHNNPMFDLAEYDYIARRLILKYCTYDFATHILNNPEALSYITECLMFGSCRWNKKKHAKSTHRGYLSRCGRWAIIRWIYLSRQRQSLEISLDTTYNDDLVLHDIIADKRYEQSIKREQLRKYIISLMNQAQLTDKQRECITRVYIYGEKPSSVAKTQGVSRQAVDQLLIHSIRKIQKRCKHIV